MTLAELIPALDALGVGLSVRLVVDAPRGALNQELRDALATYKTLLMQQVVRELVWEELSTRRWGSARDDPEPGVIVDRPARGRTSTGSRAAELERSDPQLDLNKYNA